MYLNTSESSDNTEFIIAIKQNNLDLLEGLFFDISNVNSVNYGDQLSNDPYSRKLTAASQTITPSNL
eukprot:gene22261-28832_t